MTSSSPADGVDGVDADHGERLLAAIERQSSASEKLALAAYAEAQSRIEMQERAKLARKRFRITMIAIGAAVLVFLAGIVVLFVVVLRAVHAGTDTRDTIADCVHPGGTCYQQSQRQQADVVGTLNQVTALAAACAPSYVGLPLEHRIDAIQRCVRRNLH